VLHCAAVYCSVLQCVAVCCSVLQCAAVCYSVLYCVAALTGHDSLIYYVGHDSFISDEQLDGGRDISICDSLNYLVVQIRLRCTDASMGHDLLICDT